LTLQTLALIAPVGTIVAVAIAVLLEEHFNQREMKREHLSLDESDIASADAKGPAAGLSFAELILESAPHYYGNTARDFPVANSRPERPGADQLILPLKFDRRASSSFAISHAALYASAAGYYFGARTVAPPGTNIKTFGSGNRARMLRSVNEIEQALEVVKSELASSSRSAAETGRS
jgi:hypothetical protein